MKNKFFDFLILSFRWYLIFYLISYGLQKLSMNQFVVNNEAILNQPMKNVDSFYIAWYLFSRSTFFNIATGLIEIAAAILLIFNRTVLIGAFLALTVLAQILIIDISFTTGMHGISLPLRITGMIICNIFILYYHREKVIRLWNFIIEKTSPKFKYKWWVYLILPIIGFSMDFIIALIIYFFKILVNLVN